MRAGFQNPTSEYHLLREAVNSFFLTLHEIIPCNTFFLAALSGESYLILSAWNSGEKLVEEGATLSLADMESLVNGRASHRMAFPIVLGKNRVFGQICALDRKRAFQRDDAHLLERMAELIGRLIEAEDRIKFDELTGVYRRKYAEALYYLLPSQAPKAVVFLDLDDFQRINDRYGRDTGDEVLREVGGMLREVTAPYGALAFRYAGDEFVIIIPNGVEETALQAVDQLLVRLSRPLRIGRALLQVSASIGVCLEADSLQDYIQRADAAMYQIKRGSKRGVLVYAG
ncbi:GGDEF domain-containing protein [Cohnella caldifontis]|uniref:GGDEF domain-containing protein n=1 Tax=Cohnella caldifontis TaxID=3027471 RepID=UPI0023EC59B0|nr:GGDEF domain-containing protein [Cohnella sp. YIM B05605]